MTSPFHTCLLIDDNCLDNFINKILIFRNNFAEEVIAMESAYEALSLIRNGSIKPDVIFLDIRMPIMNGFQFLNEYADLDIIKDNTKIFVLSTSCNPRDKADLENYKYVTKFIEKTLTDEKLLEIINTYCMTPLHHTINVPNMPNKLSA